MTQQWTLSPVTKEQQDGRSQYMALVAPNGRVMGTFYDPNIAETLVNYINNYDDMLAFIEKVATWDFKAGKNLYYDVRQAQEEAYALIKKSLKANTYRYAQIRKVKSKKARD